MIVLASASMTRARLLRDAGVEFTVMSPDLDEGVAKARLLADGADPRRIAEHLAEAKALAVHAKSEDLVIGADQTLDLDGVLLNKARDLTEACAQLGRLRGRAHRLHTAAAIVRDGEVIWRATSSPTLTMRALSEGFLGAYLDGCDPASLGAVGCYQLEGRGAQLFERIEGDHFAVLGLPLIELLTALRDLGALAA